METIKVILWGHEVGRLTWDKRRRNSYFTLNPDFKKLGLDIAPLTMPMGSPRVDFPQYGQEGKLYQSLPPFIADSLPDAWGNELFDLWRIQNHLPLANITPLEKLSFIGQRGMGALEFEPVIERGMLSGKVDMQALFDLAKKIAIDHENAVIRPDENLTLESLIQVGTSAGGRQPKAIIAIDQTTGEIRSGQIAGLSGYKYHILKFGDPDRSTAELEMTYCQMATEAGIAMSPSQLMLIEGCAHFLTERFDRPNGTKMHMQTLAALAPEADSYEALMHTCRKLGFNDQTIEEVYRRMVFNILSNNTDDHNKNFAFLMDEQGRWHLAPAYDMTFIFDLGGYTPNPNHCLRARGKLSGHTYTDLIEMAEDNGIRNAEAIIKRVADTLNTFRTKAIANGLALCWMGRIEHALNQNLRHFGLLPSLPQVAFELDGHRVSNVLVEPAYKGAYHLFASIDGQDRKFIFTKKMEEYHLIDTIGIDNLSPSDFKRLISQDKDFMS
ncbi:MAG: type II toxin-antitoxin system HipA family toxin [Bacteroidales bacterium]|nr:type II toxin-antitoxin system HipA family toxin [Bacteroidales bacterium]